MLLGPSIRVPQALALANRGQLQISAGTESASDVGLQDQYVANARIPKGPWRTPGTDEVACLVDGADDVPPGEVLEFLSLTTDAALARARNALARGHSITTASSRGHEDTTSLEELVPDLIHAVTSAEGRTFRLTSDVRVAFDDPQLMTTTRDPGQGNRLLGLHVDSQERRSLAERVTCQRLLSVNVAPEPRWLLFVNVSVSRIATLLKESGRADACRLGASSAGMTFLASAPEYPVFRMRLDAGQGYLGPVQNMVHDGSTAGSHLSGLRACAFGDFT